MDQRRECGSSDAATARRTLALLLALAVGCSGLPVAAAGQFEAHTTAQLDVGSTIRDSLDPLDYDHLRLHLLYPEQGRATPETTLFRCLAHRQRELLTDDVTQYYQETSSCRLCLELDGHPTPLFCWRPNIHELQHAGSMQELTAPTRTLTPGNHSARCFVRCASSTRVARIESESVAFPVVSDVSWASFKDVRHSRKEWATEDAPSLVIGVKTSMIRGLPLRQAIRETWASPSSLPPGVRVLFLGCHAPIKASFNSDATRETLAYAIELERSTHDDLLIDELGACEDSYDGLVGKVTAFLRYVSARYDASTPTVMVADDDVYIDLNRLVALVRDQVSGTQGCVYAGQVWEKQFNLLIEPVRDRNNRYYVSEQSYPMKYWPPFAFGPHYLLSVPCLGLILANQQQTEEFRGLDDVSIAVWLLSSGVRPQHVPQFKNLRDSACFDTNEGYISLADLSPTALRAIHRNLQSGRSFCYGSDLVVWLR